MEALIFVGIQASGKSTFYKENFFNSHIRISNDLLKTKNREKMLLEYCRKAKQSFVVDNTNTTKHERKKYIIIAQELKIPVIGYYFKTDLERSLRWNEKRAGKECIPEIGILGTHKKLEIPKIDEGFDKLFYVDILDGRFTIKDWYNEI